MQSTRLLSNCWLLGQQRQPGRALFSDLTTTTFPQILKELLGKKNFAFKKELDGKPLLAPPRSHWLSYEFELRREARKKYREQSVGVSSAWWTTYSDPESSHGTLAAVGQPCQLDTSSTGAVDSEHDPT